MCVCVCVFTCRPCVPTKQGVALSRTVQFWETYGPALLASAWGVREMARELPLPRARGRAV